MTINIDEPNARTLGLPLGTIALTPAGRDVLHGDADRDALSGIDRWLGGVHVQGRGPAWRWSARAGHARSTRNCVTIELRMNDADRALLVELRRLLLQLHKTLIDWQRAEYERVHGRLQTTQLLNVMFNDPAFAWLRSMSGLIVRIDETLDPPSKTAADSAEPAESGPLVAAARELIAPGSRLAVRAALSRGAAGAARRGAGAPRSRHAVEAAAARRLPRRRASSARAPARSSL